MAVAGLASVYAPAPPGGGISTARPPSYSSARAQSCVPYPARPAAFTRLRRSGQSALVLARASPGRPQFDWSGLAEEAEAPEGAEATAALASKPRRGRKRRNRPSGTEIICCASSTEYSRMVDLLSPREHVYEVAQESKRCTDDLAVAVGPRGHVTAVGVVGGRRESARSLGKGVERRYPTTSGASPAGAVTVHKVDNVWDAVKISAFYSPVNSASDMAPITTIFLDLPSVTGNDLLLDTLSLTHSLVSILKRRGRRLRVVLKSRSLMQQQETFFHAARVLENMKGNEAQRLEMALARRETHGAVVVGTEGVDEYRRATLLCLREGDKVIEIGCHTGTTTRLAAEAVGPLGRALGVDVGPSIIDRARQDTRNAGLSNIKYKVGDAWDCRSVSSLVQFMGGVDVALVDIGGISGDNGLMEGVRLVTQLVSLIQPRALIIKSTCVRRHAGELVAAYKLLSQAAVQAPT